MPTYTETLTESINLQEENDVANAMYTPFYGTLSLADSYFQYKLNSDPWDNASEIERKSALVEATRAIDRLYFIGTKLDENQVLEFPRDFQTAVPREIEHACFEIALKLLDGIDPDTERDNLSATNRGFGQVRVNYDRGFAPSHLVNGIASASAWNLLVPFLNDPNEITIRRGS